MLLTVATHLTLLVTPYILILHNQYHCWYHSSVLYTGCQKKTLQIFNLNFKSLECFLVGHPVGTRNKFDSKYNSLFHKFKFCIDKL